MKKNRKLVLFGLVLLILVLTVSFVFLVPKISELFIEPNNYRADGANEAGNTIKIDDNYYVATTSATISTLYFDDFNGEGAKSLVEHVYKLNYDKSYIIVQSVKKNFYSLFSKEFNYVIVNRKNQKTITIENKDEFLKECKIKNITVELKAKNQFDWY
ncbi:hypothetical protein [Carnobacterium sp.]|uniref:hypothetical protein n=1 Tax=Carnobacterium sp. TaxID=48221 RepID=UPI002FC7C80C